MHSKQPDFADSQRVRRVTTGALTFSAPLPGTWARSVAEDASPDYNSNNEIARFSSWAIPGSLAVTRGILVQWTSRDVAGSEPPTSPRSEHFTGPFNW
ncbi:hypothetical protein RHMOL_Rhmol10G0306700 [Rhododendron molle]|uniref:Uncharacterized protein n=1 Tax=Rhododendron molle TaxID=49168 RepID=A0ACC0M8H0_RHOML|nr:hypothetical protein RHMOL_Rhmol10G0306700 [Rhododendron molle]